MLNAFYLYFIYHPNTYSVDDRDGGLKPIPSCRDIHPE